MIARLALALTLSALVPGTPAAQQTPDARTAWNQPTAPFHVIGDVYYVGAAGVSAFLIETSDGLILLDGGLPETAPQIAMNVAALGFRMANVRYLLNSHAHFDHAGGLAELKRLSKATMVASAADAPALRAGAPDMPALTIGRVIGDGDVLRLGGTSLTAYVTPGHTKGCTTWAIDTGEGGRTYRVLFYCSTSVVDRLVGNEGYPQIVEDYERTFERFHAFTADVFLSNHPDFFEMAQKRQRMTPGAANPFVDPGELGRFVASSERQFKTALERERAGR